MQTEFPESAQAKMARLVSAEQQAQFTLNSTTRQVSELQRAIGMNPNGGRAPALRQELSFLHNTLSVQQERHADLANLNANIQAYFERLPPDAEIAEAKAVKPKLKQGEDLADALTRVRGEIASLVGERFRVERADMTLEEKIEKIRAWFLDQQSRGAPFIRWENGKPVVSFSTYIAGGFTADPDLASLMAWLSPRSMEQKLVAMIEAAPQPAFTMSSEDKAQRLKDLDRELLLWERQEEFVICAAEDKSQTLPRRVTADPRAVLGLTIRGLGLWKAKAA